MSTSYEALWHAPGDIGTTLDGARRAKGLTQTELAERVHMTQSTISLMESGKPTRYLSRLFELTRTLGIEIHVRWNDASLAPVSPDPWAFLTQLDEDGDPSPTVISTAAVSPSPTSPGKDTLDASRG